MLGASAEDVSLGFHIQMPCHQVSRSVGWLMDIHILIFCFEECDGFNSFGG